MEGLALKLLLDAHIWLWGLLEPARLVRRVARTQDDPANQLWLSPISAWEALLLAERGRIDLGRDAAGWIDNELRRTPLRDAPLTRDVALRSRSVRLEHQDPTDRFLAASVAIHERTLVTADQRLWRSREYRSSGTAESWPAGPLDVARASVSEVHPAHG